MIVHGSIEDLDSDEVGRLTLSGQTMTLTKRAQEKSAKATGVHWQVWQRLRFAVPRRRQCHFGNYGVFWCHS